MTTSNTHTLEQGFGTGKTLYFDCFSGLSGDMIISSLIDLGVPLKIIKDAAAALPLDGYNIRVKKEPRRSLEVSRFFVDVNEGEQPHRHFCDIRDMIEQSQLNQEVKTLSIKIFELVAQAEAKAHGSTVEHVHFHEVGAVDSIVDIVGAAAALTYIGAQIEAAPVPLGRGFVKTQHGILPVPAPATLLILQGVPVEGTDIESELTTPTGAAIICATAKRFGPIPSMIPEFIGLGAGARSHKTRPGILRVVLGKPTTGYIAYDDGMCWVIEANIDDITGEIAASAAEKIMNSGALDVWIEPIQMKKSRPAIKISVLAAKNDLAQMSTALMRETTTIGLRYYGVGRMEMKRSIKTVSTQFGDIRVKISTGFDNCYNAAPEFEDCKKAAQKHSIPVKTVLAIATGLAQELIPVTK